MAEHIESHLDYIRSATEEGVAKTLSLVEGVLPTQMRLLSDAIVLQDWIKGFDASKLPEADRQNFLRLAEFVAQAGRAANHCRNSLVEILTSLEFQDLTGQVLQKLAEAIRRGQSMDADIGRSSSECARDQAEVDAVFPMP